MFLAALKIRATLADPAVGSCEQVVERLCKMCRSQQLGSALQKIQEMKFQLKEKEIWHYCQERNLVVQLHCLEQRRLFCCFRV